MKRPKTLLKIGNLWVTLGRLDREFPLRIKIQWGKGAGYIGGFTAHIRLSPLTRHCKNQYLDYRHMCYKTPIIGITRNGNRWLI